MTSLDIDIDPLPSGVSDGDFLNAVWTGLGKAQKQIPSLYFYDHRGSELFEEITKAPEYYPTRTEISLLKAYASKIAEYLPKGAALIEIGAGSSRKTPLLINALRNPVAYVPIDISKTFLLEAADNMRAKLNGLKVLPLTGDFTQTLKLPDDIAALPKVGFFAGSTIGNFTPEAAGEFLARAKTYLGANSWFVVGVDVKKPIELLNNAYNDKAGITAEFNLNLLARINRELAGNFNLDHFKHHAFYNQDLGRIEMHLKSLDLQKVDIAGRKFTFKKDESIHTENSYKYAPEEFKALAAKSGWQSKAYWLDNDDLFSLHLLQTDTN